MADEPADCGCRVEEVWVDNFKREGFAIYYCPKHEAADEMHEGLKASLAALEYVEKYYMPSYSAASEMWSFVNGYDGNPDIRAIIAQAEKE